jgi:leucyl-tRNA synthetase
MALQVLYDLGVVSTKEPFGKLVSQGMILGEVEYTAFQDSNGAWTHENAADATPVKVQWN